MTSEERQAIRDYLYLDPPVGGVQRKSSFMGALIDTRRIANRDVDTGELAPGAPDSGGWMAAIGYLVLLDLIGSCFTASGPDAPPAFIRALAQFSDVSPHEREALYAVRCALAHDYSLINRRRLDSRRHVFAYDDREGGPLVELRREQWSGDYADVRPGRQDLVTRVNLRAVGDLVEGIVVELRARHAAGRLAIALPEGLVELRARYFMYYPSGDPAPGT